MLFGARHIGERGTLLGDRHSLGGSQPLVGHAQTLYSIAGMVLFRVGTELGVHYSKIKI